MPHLRFRDCPQEYLDYTLTPPGTGARTETLVVYVHGFGSHQGGEKALFFRNRFVDMGFAYLAFDHRGHGSSSGTMTELTISRSIEDLGLILSAHRKDYKRSILIGSSMGGQTASWFAAQNPDRVAANLLIAPGFRFLENRIRDLGPKGLEILRKEGEMTVRTKWVEARIGKQLLEDAEHYPMEKLIPMVRTPTLILHGTEDDTVPFEDSVTFVQKAKARPLDLLLIAGGDHRLTDQKETLFLEMKTFLKRNGFLET